LHGNYSVSHIEQSFLGAFPDFPALAAEAGDQALQRWLYRRMSGLLGGTNRGQGSDGEKE
jgi:hypothetical protein